MAKAQITNPVLKSWTNLNEELQDCDEKTAETLLKEELAGRRRKQFLLRIHSRINKLRADRERMELVAETK